MFQKQGVGGAHQFTVLIPGDPAQIPSVYQKHLTDVGDGRLGVVVGAHNVDGKLEVRVNQVADLAASREYFSGVVTGKSWRPQGDFVSTPNGVGNYINSFIKATINYRYNTLTNRIDYPNMGLGKNSNTWNQSIHSYLGGTTRVNFKGAEPGNDSRFPNSVFQ